MHRRLVASLFCKIAFLVHICPSNQLDAQIKAELFRGFDFKWDYFNHALQILLVAIHNDDFVSTIKPVGQLVSD